MTVEGRQLCVEGLAHGQRYEVKLRAGLPSDIGETLAKPPRSPSMCPTASRSCASPARATCCPRAASRAFRSSPSTPSQVGVEIYRVGDRNLAGDTAATATSQRQLSSYELETLRERTRQRRSIRARWMSRQAQRGGDDGVPVGEAVPELKPGVYAMIARPRRRQDASDDDDGARDAVVHRLRSRPDRILRRRRRACVRALAGRRRARRRRQRAPRRAQQRGARPPPRPTPPATSASTPGSARGEGGLQPAILVAENGAGDYAFLDLDGGGVRPVGPRRQGPRRAGPARRLPLCRARRLSSGRDVNLTALVRDRAGKAVERAGDADRRRVPTASSTAASR